MFIDTHAHLSEPGLAAELPAVLERARRANVRRIVSVATNLDDARRTLEIAHQHPEVFAAVGLHPAEAHNVAPADIEELAALAAAPKVLAIGETGLDYYRGQQHAQQQKDLLCAQLQLAKQRQLPVIIHSRGNVQADLLAILRAHAGSLPNRSRPWGVMHCFSADERFALDCIELGLLISFTGMLTFHNAEAVRKVARKIPLQFVMLETDAPYLAPAPYRGTRNEPARLPLIAKALAEIKALSLQQIAAATTTNATRLFGLR
jgi:TatD DNase family protein